MLKAFDLTLSNNGIDKDARQQEAVELLSVALINFLRLKGGSEGGLGEGEFLKLFS